MQNHPPALSLTRLELARPLSVRVFRASDSALLGSARVQTSDFAEVAGEAWLNGCLRQGHPEMALSELPMRLAPVLAEQSEDRCAAFQVEVLLGNGRRPCQTFGFKCVRHVANRLAAQLLAGGTLKPDDAFLWDAAADPPASVATSSSLGPAGGTGPAESATSPRSGSIKTAKVAYLNIRLRPLLEASTPVALLDETVPPVFYTHEAFARAEACARRGAARELETGAALFGSLAACPESGEFFAIVRDAAEIEGADEQRLSLTYSHSSWQRLQKIQQARRAALATPTDRLLGQAHGHPFRPNDGKVCAECSQRPTCSLTSAWASQEDEVWHKAVFTRQPWALCHIFGLNARGEAVHQLFGLKEGRLQARGFYLLPSGSADILVRAPGVETALYATKNSSETQ